MERTEVLDMMGELKLYGMKAAYDETLATALKRKHEPQRFVSDLLKAGSKPECEGSLHERGVCGRSAVPASNWKGKRRHKSVARVAVVDSDGNVAGYRVCVDLMSDASLTEQLLAELDRCAHRRRSASSSPARS